MTKLSQAVPLCNSDTGTDSCHLLRDILSGGCVDAVRQEPDLTFGGFQLESSANKVPGPCP